MNKIYYFLTGLFWFVSFTLVSWAAGFAHRKFYRANWNYMLLTDSLIPRFSHATFLVFGIGVGFTLCFLLTKKIFDVLVKKSEQEGK